MKDRLAAARLGMVNVNGRREALYIALAAAEVCWTAPVFLMLLRIAMPHPRLLLWLAMLVLLLGAFYFYRAVVKANLSLRFQQSLLVAALLLSIGLFFRFHIYAGAGLQGVDWFLQPFRNFASLTALLPLDFIAIMTLIHLWARGIHLARRSITANSVGFSFRSGVVILAGLAWVIGLFTGEDMSGFIIPFFFFALVAVALARIEEVSSLPNSSRAPFSGFWIGSTVSAVALLVALGMAVAAVFRGGGLELVLRWFLPLLIVLQVLVVGLILLIVTLVAWIVSLVPIDWGALREGLQRALEALLSLSGVFAPPPESRLVIEPAVVGTAHAGVLTAIIVVMVALVVLFTWWQLRRDPHGEADESRESLFSAGMLGRNLLAMLQSGRDRLSQLAGLVDQFGLGSRLLSAVTIQRIYANLVRLASKAGYPRLQTQTPYEYLETLHKALPGRELDVALITEAYVNSHYGQVPDGREELQRIRECWERIRAQGTETKTGILVE
jgi:hypothetical protein